VERLQQLYKTLFGRRPERTEKLPGAGSNRTYYRLSNEANESVVGVIGTSRDENHAFIYLARHFKLQQLPVPEVLAATNDELCYLQEDLGSTSLYDAIAGGRAAGGRYNRKETELLKSTIRGLADMQMRGAIGLEWDNCYPQPAFDQDSVSFDLNYFKYCFLKATELDFHELKLEANFRMLAKDLTAEEGCCFLYRDFQARNVMLKSVTENGKTRQVPYFIDFQGGRRGPCYYDPASFLWQASAHYSHKLRRTLLMEYYEALKPYTEVPSTRHFAEQMALFVLFRTLQVLGAYGFRGYFERKKHFIDSIPPAMQNLRELLDDGNGGFGLTLSARYPYLVETLRRLTEMPAFAPQEMPRETRSDGFRVTDRNVYDAHPQDGPATFSKYDGKGPLVVRVYSFSYHKGIPEDESGNGGGYVFDCRSTHNPGRYEPYKQLTGLDEPVIRFLEDDGEILDFLQHVYRLAETHVRRYIQRGFTSLMFCFGCTGGQHRSVYSAQHLAEHLHEMFGVEVHICHREQGISQVLPARPTSAAQCK